MLICVFHVLFLVFILLVFLLLLHMFIMIIMVKALILQLFPSFLLLRKEVVILVQVLLCMFVMK